MTTHQIESKVSIRAEVGHLHAILPGSLVRYIQAALGIPLIVNTSVMKLGWEASFLEAREAQSLYNDLLGGAPWERKMKKNGEPSVASRWSVMFGTEGATYTTRGGGGPSERPYWEKTRVARPWPAYLLPIKSRLERATGRTYQQCIALYYPGGSVGIKPHRDKEMSQGYIAGLSLYAEDDQYRHLQFSLGERTFTPIKLTQGSLYVMVPPTNDYCLHSILGDKACRWGRISLTFREK